MKTSYATYMFFALVTMQWSCSQKQTKQKEIVLQPNYNKIQDIVSIADCDSPFGKYITEVRSSNDGSCYFYQKFSDTNAPFIVKIEADNSGYLIDEQDVVLDTLSDQDVQMIRSHEIHKMSVDPDFFFKAISYKKQMKFHGNEHEVYSGKDGLEHPVKIVYDRSKKLISKIELCNPKDTTQTIEMIFNRWLTSEYGELVKEIEIVQSQKDTFHFDFRSLIITDETGDHIIFN